MVFTNSRGVKYYSHMKEVVIGRNKAKIKNYFFKREKGEGYVSSLPDDRKVIETWNGLPFAKKI